MYTTVKCSPKNFSLETGIILNRICSFIMDSTFLPFVFMAIFNFIWCRVSHCLLYWKLFLIIFFLKEYHCEWMKQLMLITIHNILFLLLSYSFCLLKCFYGQCNDFFFFCDQNILIR